MAEWCGRCNGEHEVGEQCPQPAIKPEPRILRCSHCKDNLEVADTLREHNKRLIKEYRLLYASYEELKAQHEPPGAA